jgi:hypothetical protein
LVEGKGEDRWDIWKAYFRDGKFVVYAPQIVFPEFKEQDLK